MLHIIDKKTYLNTPTKLGGLIKGNKIVRTRLQRENLEIQFLHLAKVDKFKTDRANDQRDERRAKRK
jgi:hypothetical protein